LVLALLLIAWLVLPPVLMRLIRGAAFEAHAPALKIASYTRDLQEFWALRTTPRAELIAAGRDLMRFNAAMELRLIENDLLRAEIQRMEQILRLPPPAGFSYEVARVERRDMSAWWQQIVVRKGANFNIQPGSAVVFAGGAVGRVREVGAYSSVIDLISGPEVRIAAVLEGDTRPVQYQGGVARAFQAPSGRVSFVPPDVRIDPERPLRVLTSGLGGAFPEGLVIGTVDQLEPSPDGLFQHGTVRLDPRLDALREVSILVPGEIQPLAPRLR
jgi:rod shape-determining protein MreC